MDIRSVNEKDLVRATVSGRIDEIGAQRLEAFFNGMDLKPISQLILDFRDVVYIGSAGVGILLLLYKKLALRNGKITIENIPIEIYGLLADEMNLRQVFTLKRI